MKKIILLTMLLMSAQFADTQVMNRILAGQNIIQLINSNNYLYCLPSPDNRVFPASFDVLRLKTYNITGFNDTVLSIGNIHYQPIGNYYSTPTGSTSEYIRGDGSRATFPTIPASPVNADWNAPSGLAMIQNKPTVLSAFTNDANYISQSAGDIRYAMLSDTFPVGNIMTTRGANNAINGLTTAVNGKQPTLVSGANIKAIEGQSLLGSGNIDLSKADIGLPNVDNTSDAAKPVSTAQAAAIALKQNTLTLTTTGTGAATLNVSTGALNIPTPASAVGVNNAASYGAGTAYSLTTTSAKVTFGTTSPSITIPAAGTYLIMSNVKIEYSGLLTLGATSANLKLRRTNNTAADLSNATTTYNVPAISLTALTQTAGDADIQPVIYTTTNSNDVIEIWGSRGANVSAGSIQIGEASIVAIRLY